MSLHNDQRHRLTRLFLIYHLLEVCGEDGCVKRIDLENACNCTARTIQRDLKFLQAAGAVITYCRSRRSYVLERPLPLLSVELQLPDLMILVLLQGTMHRQSGFPQAVQARTLNKLLARLPAKLRREMAAARDVMDFGEKARRDYSSAPITELMFAARTRRSIQMTYHSMGRDTIESRRVDPYSLTLRNGYLSLIAYCHRNKDVRLFSLDSIKTLSVTEQIFTIPRDFSLSAYIEGMVGGMRGRQSEIVVKFKPEVMRWARKICWEFPHTCEETTEGLIMRGQVSGLEAIRKDLMRWGSQVEVLSPPELRAAIRREAEALAVVYAEK